MHAKFSYTSIFTTGSGEGGDGDGAGNMIGLYAGADSIIIPELPSLSVDCRIPETDRLTPVITTAISAAAISFEFCDVNLISVVEVELLIIDYERKFSSNKMDFISALYVGMGWSHECAR